MYFGRHKTRIPVPFDLSLLIITDTHGRLRKEDLPDPYSYDACFLLGDMTPKDLVVLKHHVAPNVPTFGVLGNHDRYASLEKAGIENIHERVIEIKGIRVAGFQGSLGVPDNKCPLYTDEESIEIAYGMESADILISHDSPKLFQKNCSIIHTGLRGIRDYCFKNQVPLNIHGHHHLNYKQILSNGTLSVGCYKCRELHTGQLWKGE